MYFSTFVFLIGLVSLLASTTLSVAKGRYSQPMRRNLDYLTRMKTVVGP